MPNLTYYSQKFPPHFKIRAEETTNVSWAELVWAAITVGKPESRNLFLHGIYSHFEYRMRLYMLKVHLMESASGEYEQTQVYKGLDPSEKTALSYFLGLTMAKLLAHRRLKTPWLQHIDRCQEKLNFVAKKRPDLVGLSRESEWLVMEAKGRSGAADEKALQNAELQTDELLDINGITDLLRVVSMTYFAGPGSLRVRWQDPPEFNQEAPSLTIEPLEFLRLYYEPLRSFINPAEQQITSESFSGFTFNMVTLSDFDVRIGLINQPDNFFLERPNWARNAQITRYLNPASGAVDDRTFLGDDGILIQLGSTWDIEAMRQEPLERRPIS
ncbi:hypothetical protein EJV47_04610 [Hymenobacter gummosus]|uniref:Uncharacterized protein n=1 Tax=Hymenobacter gummosus TaxID=1776032 RepID=A0A431U6H4_9BACT|nr:hypothetical protein [Hymenobacter gummosus]RTQ52309.1 hypothetical protein EJV47_04610 [Hymenobacter gummosus]